MAWAVTGSLGLYKTEDRMVLPLSAECQLHIESCHISIPDGGDLVLSITQDLSSENIVNGFSPEKSMRVVVEVSGLATDWIRVLLGEKDAYIGSRLSGNNWQDSDFGALRYELYPGNNGQIFSGEMGLSFCASTLVEWIILLEVGVGNTVYEIPFEFETESLSGDEGHEM